ncbi:hypothetical protein G9P44_002427 [Scheffersomyces stipitis]|nr:hypothetical protein G9P44_002427 [Scheffersomyces stipitis]
MNEIMSTPSQANLYNQEFTGTTASEQNLLPQSNNNHSEIHILQQLPHQIQHSRPKSYMLNEPYIPLPPNYQAVQQNEYYTNNDYGNNLNTISPSLPLTNLTQGTSSGGQQGSAEQLSVPIQQQSIIQSQHDQHSHVYPSVFQQQQQQFYQQQQQPLGLQNPYQAQHTHMMAPSTYPKPLHNHSNSNTSTTTNSSSKISHSRNSSSSSTVQEYPDVAKPKIATVFWEDEKTICYQVRARGVLVSRREDTNFVNGTKLLNVIGMTRGKRDGILKTEKTRNVVKVGSMNLKGVWIPFDRAFEIARNEGVDEALHPLFVKDIKTFYKTKGYKLKISTEGNEIVKTPVGSPIQSTSPGTIDEKGPIRTTTPMVFNSSDALKNQNSFRTDCYES